MQPHIIYMWIYVHMYVHIYMWNEPTGPEILPWAKNCGTCSSSTSEHVTLSMDSLKNSHVEQVNWSRKSLLGQKSPSQVPQPTTCSWGTWSRRVLAGARAPPLWLLLTPLNGEQHLSLLSSSLKFRLQRQFIQLPPSSIFSFWRHLSFSVFAVHAWCTNSCSSFANRNDDLPIKWGCMVLPTPETHWYFRNDSVWF